MKNSSLAQETQNRTSIMCSPATVHRCRPLPKPPSSIPIARSDPYNPYPTTFVQADTSSFKHVVQMLTGSTDSSVRPEPARRPIPPAKTGLRKDHKSKLYERRNSLKNFKLSPLAPEPVYERPGLPRPGTPEILSPSILDFPSLALSPVTPLVPDPFNRVGSVNYCGSDKLDTASEDKAIRDKGFYLHPSPANTPRETEPRLLSLFPVTSPNS